MAFFGDANSEMEEILELIGHKCSICFISESDIDLIACGDQFCFSCLETYWLGRLREGSWGLRPVTLDCPVCKVAISEGENWERWAKGELRQLYYETKRRRATITRACPDCGHEQSILGEPMDDDVAILLEELDDHLGDLLIRQLMRRLIDTDYGGILRLMSRANAARTGPTEKLVYFLRRLLQICMAVDDEDRFASKQLLAMALCSGTLCDFCGSRICLRCGQNDWHAGMTCMASLKVQLATTNLDEHEMASLKWKVTHCKPCPKCFLLVSKDDDGSCNQMHCSCCGHLYCWECQREWSSLCGYYRCSQTETNGSGSENNSDGKKRHRSRQPVNSDPEQRRPPEAGVPDVSRLPSFGASSSSFG